jgi:hypothetical protein
MQAKRVTFPEKNRLYSDLQHWADIKRFHHLNHYFCVDARGDVPEPPAQPTVMENNLRFMHMIKDQLTSLLKTPSLLRPNASFVGKVTSNICHTCTLCVFIITNTKLNA